MPRPGGGQLALFGHPRELQVPDEVARLGAGLHPLLRLGTSSWTFPGWAGLCYPPEITDEELSREGLRHYARYPLFRTVGIDRSHYRPLTRDELADYAGQLPPGFRCVEKVWDRVTLAAFPAHDRYGPLQGRRNEAFLDPAVFLEEVWAPHVGTFEDRLTAFVLELAPMPPSLRPSPGAFAGRLDRFLAAMPKTARFAVELRDPELLGPDYRAVLAAHRAAHVYNWWGRMPSIGRQLDLAPPTTDFLVARLLLRPGTTYESRKRAFAPFDRIQDPAPELHDDVARLAELAVSGNTPLDVIVNNKAEGSAPLTVLALARRLGALR
jgi:uncharacterized protein YecE (DUF72 family)